MGNNAARLAAADIALFVLGLRELREMIEYGEAAAQKQSEWVNRSRIYGGTLHAMNARIAGMLDAWGAELEAARKAAE